MFRVKASEVHVRIPMTAAIVVAALVVAFALSAAAVYQVFEEYRLLGSWLARPGPVLPAEIDALQRDMGTRIMVRSTALAILVLSTVATLWLQQRQLAIRRTLHQVKLLARYILASMDPPRGSCPRVHCHHPHPQSRPRQREQGDAAVASNHSDHIVTDRGWSPA
jgi:hypothetical protein